MAGVKTLSDADVVRMRREYTPVHSYRYYGEKYGVSTNTARLIISGEARKDVELPPNFNQAITLGEAYNLDPEELKNIINYL